MPRNERPDLQDIYEEIIDKRYNQLWSDFNLSKHIQKKYKVSKVTAYKYIRGAKEEYSEYIRETKINMFDDLIQNFEALRQKSFSDGNLKEARESTKELAKLLGYYDQSNIQSENVDNEIKITIIKKNKE